MIESVYNRLRLNNRSKVWSEVRLTDAIDAQDALKVNSVHI